jgi:hypothetical protein
MDALALLSVVGVDVLVPMVSVTVPVGTGFPLPPLTLIVTVRSWAMVTLGEEVVTATVGTIFDGAVTFTEPVPVALL